MYKGYSAMKLLHDAEREHRANTIQCIRWTERRKTTTEKQVNHSTWRSWEKKISQWRRVMYNVRKRWQPTISVDESYLQPTNKCEFRFEGRCIFKSVKLRPTPRLPGCIFFHSPHNKKMMSKSISSEICTNLIPLFIFC